MLHHASRWPRSWRSAAVARCASAQAPVDGQPQKHNDVELLPCSDPIHSPASLVRFCPIVLIPSITGCRAPRYSECCKPHIIMATKFQDLQGLGNQSTFQAAIGKAKMSRFSPAETGKTADGKSLKLWTTSRTELSAREVMNGIAANVLGTRAKRILGVRQSHHQPWQQSQQQRGEAGSSPAIILAPSLLRCWEPFIRQVKDFSCCFRPFLVSDKKRRASTNSMCLRAWQTNKLLIDYQSAPCVPSGSWSTAVTRGNMCAGGACCCERSLPPFVPSNSMVALLIARSLAGPRSIPSSFKHGIVFSQLNWGSTGILTHLTCVASPSLALPSHDVTLGQLEPGPGALLLCFQCSSQRSVVGLTPDNLQFK